MTKELAVYKHVPSKSMPIRRGPVQCIRNCTRCILTQIYDDDVDFENIVAIRSYDDLNRRKKSWISNFQTLQYHLGQVDVLKQTLKTIDANVNIYIVATTRRRDIRYLQQVMFHERLPRARVVTSNIDLDSSSRSRNFIIPIRLICCDTLVEIGDELLNSDQLNNMLSPIIDEVQKPGSSLNVSLIPVVISKDHDFTTVFGLGSLCVQIMQPYPIKEYINNTLSRNMTDHIVHHLYHDLSRFGARLPSHLVALLLVYLDRPKGVSREDLVDYLEWFQKSAMELDIHLAFTGKTDNVIDYALLILNDFVKYDTLEQVFRVKNSKALTYYASVLIPNLAYYGIISRAILMLYNIDKKNTPLLRFAPGNLIKVMRDDLLELSQDIAEKLDRSIPCRRPCIDIRTSIVASFNSMMTFGKYFKVQEARVRPSKGFGWLGDYDSDEDYYLSKRDDPAFKPWVILTSRPYRLDRLNLFINVMEAYLEWISSDRTNDNTQSQVSVASIGGD